jgi:SAM-dependent methyltransferase
MDSHAWDDRYAADELVWSAEPNRWVEAELAGQEPGRALDLAAGEGRNSIWLAGQGWQVTAVDFSSVALDKGRRLAASFDDDRHTRLVWHDADLLEYVPEPAAYDLVLLIYLQVIAAERRLILRSAVEALAPGGTLLVVGHDSRNLTEGTGGPQDPSVLFTPAEVTEDLAASGTAIRIEKAEQVLRPVAGAPRPAIDALVRVRALGE